MGLALEIFGLAAAVSLAVSFVVAWLAPRLLGAGARAFASQPIALTVGYCAGYLILPRSWAALVPDQSWHWLPVLSMLAAVATAAWSGRGRLALLPWFALVALAALAGHLLTPSWTVFGLSWPLSTVVAIGYFILIATSLECLPPRFLGQPMIALLAVAAALSAAAIGADVSLRFAQLAAIAAAGLAGCWLVGFFGARPSERSLRGLILSFAVLVGGIAFVACVEPDPPRARLLVLPLTPLIAWLGLVRRPR